MCGRYVTREDLKWREIVALIRLTDVAAPLSSEATYDAVPNESQPIICLNDQGERVIGHMVWGFIPEWAKSCDKEKRMKNACAETLTEKPYFREAFAKRRCLVPADGFYEWKRGEARSVPPYLITLKDRKPFAFAGLWERWQPSGRGAFLSFTIITVEANADMAPVHDRQPVMLTEEEWDPWLKAASTEEAAKLLKPCPLGALAIRRIEKSAKKPRNETLDLFERLLA